MDSLTRNMAVAGGLLALFAIVGTGLVALTAAGTAERIAANERATLMRTLHELVDPDRHDNDPAEDVALVRDREALGSDQPLPVYRLRQDGEPVAAVMSVVAPDGYGGPIRLLVAVEFDGTVAGVRVVSHAETPGLGDDIEARRSDWIRSFEGRRLGDPPQEQWTVRRDGGQFDQFTGATITPRAVVNAVARALNWYEENRATVFETGIAKPAEEADHEFR